MLKIIPQFNALISQNPIFWFCALAGTGMGIIQFILNFFGAHNSDDQAANEMDVGKFQWLSKQAFTGFLMMFGLVGLTCKKQFDLSTLLATLLATFGGCAAIFFSALILNISRKLRSSGTVFRIEDAIGKEATIYQCIPRGGKGKVSVSIHDFTHEIEAISNSQEDLPSFMLVQIIKQADEKTVIVVPTK